MGVRGLFNYITQNPENFSYYELHNTYLVVDAANYIIHCYLQSQSPSQYGGEYLSFAVSIRNALKQFQKCRITPIFVFDGCHERGGSKRETLLFRNKERIDAFNEQLSIQSNCDADSLEVPSNMYPELSHSVFFSIIKELGMHHISCDHEADIHAAELALYLNCPLLSIVSDLFVCAVQPEMNYRLIFPKFIEEQCKLRAEKCQSCQTECYVLPCKVFKPSQSVLGRIYAPLLPMLPVLVGNDIMRSTRLPSAITNRIKSTYLPGMSFSGRRIDAALNWLSGYSQDVTSPIREILSLYQGKELEEITALTITCVQYYVLDLHTVCQQLAEVLSLKLDETTRNTPVRNISRQPPSEKIELNYANLDDAVEAVKTALLSTKPSSVPVDKESLMTYRWPQNLITKFRQGGLSPAILDALYVCGGSVLRILLEDLRLENSIFKVAEPIRRLEYGLLIHLEHKLGCAYKLCASDHGFPREARRSGSEMCCFEMPVPPVAIPPGPDSLKQFCKQYLSLDLHNVKSDSQLDRTLVCVLVLWARHSQLVRPFDNLRNSPVALAFITCSLITSILLNSRVGGKEVLSEKSSNLCNHFKRLGDDFKEHCSQIKSHQLSIRVVHQINELQLIYQEFQMLIGLLDVLCIESYEYSVGGKPSEQFLTFLPEWIVFASCRLLHWFSLTLQHCVPGDRLQQLRHKWIPRILQEIPEHQNINAKVLGDQVCNLVFAARDQIKSG